MHIVNSSFWSDVGNSFLFSTCCLLVLSHTIFVLISRFCLVFVSGGFLDKYFDAEILEDQQKNDSPVTYTLSMVLLSCFVSPISQRGLLIRITIHLVLSLIPYLQFWRGDDWYTTHVTVDLSHSLPNTMEHWGKHCHYTNHYYDPESCHWRAVEHRLTHASGEAHLRLITYVLKHAIIIIIIIGIIIITCVWTDWVTARQSSW